MAAREAAHQTADRSGVSISAKNSSWYLRVKTFSEEYLVDVGPDADAAQSALEDAKRRMRETGAVTVGRALVVSASDIESIAIQDASAAPAEDG